MEVVDRGESTELVGLETMGAVVKEVQMTIPSFDGGARPLKALCAVDCMLLKECAAGVRERVELVRDGFDKTVVMALHFSAVFAFGAASLR